MTSSWAHLHFHPQEHPALLVWSKLIHLLLELNRVALLGLGVPAAAVAHCKQYVVQIPGEAEAALHKLRTKLAGSFPRALPQGLSQALDSLQVNPQRP